MPHWSAQLKLGRGFTQIELIITVVIVGVIAAIAAPSFTVWLRRQRLNEAFSQIELAIKQTQSEAMKRGYSCQLTIPPNGTVSPTFSGNCLLSGDFVLEDMTLNTTADQNPWVMSFNARGEQSVDSGGKLWLSTSAGGSTMQSKCLVVAGGGIGLWRTGKLTASNDCLTP
jgi:prepilin-type N-terminal cleavage/methylation domain-containing protein